MKQKLVIKVAVRVSSTVNQKSRNKTLQFVAGFRGVESAALAGKDRSEIVVVGDGVDAIKLTMLVRKKFGKSFFWQRYKIGYAELVSVSAVEERAAAAEPAVQTRALAWSYGASNLHSVRETGDHCPCVDSTLLYEEVCIGCFCDCVF